MLEGYGKPALQRWTRAMWGGLALIITGLVGIYALPGLLGKPLTSKTIHLVLTTKLNQDCEFQRAFSVFTSVYREFHVIPSLSDRGPVPSEEGWIFVGPPIALSAAQSAEEHGLRYIGINLDHPDFTTRSLAHEFGHHRFGDVGIDLGDCINLFLNFFWDIRNNRRIDWGLSNQPLPTPALIVPRP